MSHGTSTGVRIPDELLNPTKASVTISVSAETNAGGRRHMEDFVTVHLYPDKRFDDIPYLRDQIFVGVFDGHGGKEAALVAKKRLWEVIQDNPKFHVRNFVSVCESLEESFVTMHKEMEPLRAKWKTNKMGDLSTAGTTASILIIRQNCILTANVGDSTIVLAQLNEKAAEPGEHPLTAVALSKDHRPDNPEEYKQVEKLGGQVVTSRKGVPRVVWERHRVDPETGDEKVDSVPFLSVSRSLGDFWSYCPRTEKYVVSPFPDVRIEPLNALFMKFMVLASDGLWNVMTHQEVVEFVWDYTNEMDEEKLNRPRDVVRALINEALNRWKRKQLVADNISVILVFFSADDPPKWPYYKRYTSYMAKVKAAKAKRAASAAPPTPTSGSTVSGESSASTVSPESSASTASPTLSSGSTINEESSANTVFPAASAAPPTLSSGSTGENSASTVPPAASVASPTPTSGSTINEESSASAASPTPSSGSTVDGESSELRKNPTPCPPPTASPAPPTSPSKSPSPSTSTSRSSSAPPSSLLPNQSQEQQDHSPSTISSVNTTEIGSTSHFKETIPGEVTVEFHTEIKHRHRKKPKRRSSHSKVKDDKGSHSDGDISGSTSTSSYSLDPTGSLKRSPLKRERSEEDATTSSEPLPKKSKLDLPDSGCDCSADKMESDDSSPPADVAETAPMDHDQTSSYELSSGVESDDSEGRNKPAENPKSDTDSSSAVVEDVSSPVPSSIA